MPFVSPFTVIDPEVDIAVNVTVLLPGVEVAVYDMIGLPPLIFGAVKKTVASSNPAVALTFVGAPGTAAGVTSLEASEVIPVPIAFFAVTLKV